MHTFGTLYLLPTPLADNTLAMVIPSHNLAIIKPIKHFIVEEIKTARRFLKACDIATAIDDITFFELNEHTNLDTIEHMLAPAFAGFDMGIISEAGCPAVADPGAAIIKLAHQKHIKVVPLIGPSSIILALMASGMNGQNFSFVGYLPLKDALKPTLRQLEQLSKQKNQTQLFIEAPYRNQKLLDEIVQTCHPDTLLCIATNITAFDEYIVTKPLREWKKNIPDINKKPTVFLMHCL